MHPVTKQLLSGLSTIGVSVRGMQKIYTLRKTLQGEQTTQKQKKNT